MQSVNPTLPNDLYIDMKSTVDGEVSRKIIVDYNLITQDMLLREIATIISKITFILHEMVLETVETKHIESVKKITTILMSTQEVCTVILDKDKLEQRDCLVYCILVLRDMHLLAENYDIGVLGTIIKQTLKRYKGQ